MDIIDWSKHELLPVVVQEDNTSQVLMLAYVNKEALSISLSSGYAHYFSRSKNRIWKKGEQSGNTQILKEVYIDCDIDALLFKVSQNNVACHTGNVSCFYRKINLDNINVDYITTYSEDIPYNVIDKLYHVLQDKKLASSKESYTAFLYKEGENTIGKKIVEEASELAFSIKDSNTKDIIHECADLFYHALVGLSYRDISPDRVMQELNNRFSMSGLEEKARRKG